jgi:hypothetical protein
LLAATDVADSLRRAISVETARRAVASAQRTAPGTLRGPSLGVSYRQGNAYSETALYAILDFLQGVSCEATIAAFLTTSPYKDF